MDNLVYHYTDLNALLGIIQNKHLEFFGSRYDCMNDPFDCSFAKNKIIPYMMEVAKSMDFQDAELDYLETTPFVVSFSKYRDDFFMWRLYNAQVSLILDRSYFERSTANSALIDCEYVSDSVDEYKVPFEAIDKKINNCRNVSANVARITTFMKHKSFECEGEVRLATWEYYSKDGAKTILPDCIKDDAIADKQVFSRTKSNGNICLYKKFHIDKNALVGIIAHTYSQEEFDFFKKKLRTILIENGYAREVYENITPTKAYPIN